MGSTSTKPMKPYAFVKKPTNQLNQFDKEMLCTKRDVEYCEELKAQVAGWSKKRREQLLQPVNNDAEPDYKFRRLRAPLDDQGYCQSFPVEKEQAISDFFAVYGFVVIRDVLNEGACEDSVEEVWDFIDRHVRGVNSEQPATWNKWTSMSSMGYLGTSSVLSPQFAANRVNPKVYKAFRNILQETELYVDVGGAGCMRPTKKVGFPAKALARMKKEGADLDIPDDTNQRDTDELIYIDRPDWRSLDGPDWLHWDMNPFTGAVTSKNWAVQDIDRNRDYRLRVQGFLALTDCKADDGGFFCVPGAHKHIRKWAKHNVDNRAMRNRVLNPFTTVQYFVPANDPMKEAGQEIPVRKGSLVIWNSALPHSNYPNRSNNFRMVQYVKMTSATHGDFRPLHEDMELIRPFILSHPSDPLPQFQFSELAKRLFGFSKWGKAVEQTTDDDDDRDPLDPLSAPEGF